MPLKYIISKKSLLSFSLVLYCTKETAFLHPFTDLHPLYIHTTPSFSLNLASGISRSRKGSCFGQPKNSFIEYKHFFHFYCFFDATDGSISPRKINELISKPLRYAISKKKKSLLFFSLVLYCTKEIEFLNPFTEINFEFCSGYN